MTFDTNLILLDGSIDLTAATDTAPTSTTRDAATGAAVLDIKKTALRGLAAVLICADSANGDTDTLTAFIECSSEVDFTSDVSEHGKFDKLATDKGIIVGSEVPDVFIVRFSTDKRYVRLNATVGASPDDFGTVYCYLTPWAFNDL